MDTELARTFLAVVSTGSFISAAERLHVTQSTVSARILSLEEQLGCVLFIRNKAGTKLTPAGAQFQKHASTLVQTVERARQEVGIPHRFNGVITVGGRLGLWDQFLDDWIPQMRQQNPDISIRYEIGFEPDLMQGLIDARLDVGVMYTPQNRPGLIVEPLLEDRLILVSTKEKPDPVRDSDYVCIDWGPEFFRQHSASFPDFTSAALTANVGWLGMNQILQFGGSGYFPERLVAPLLQTGRLHQIEETPDFLLPAFIVHSAKNDKPHITMAVKSIKELAKEL